MATMTSAKYSKYSNLRQQHLSAAAGTENYEGIAHATFNGAQPVQFRFSLDNFFTNISNANFSNALRSQDWTAIDVSKQMDGRDFYFDYPNPIQNTLGVYFEFGIPGGNSTTNFELNIPKADYTGPFECRSNDLIWADMDQVVRTNNLFGWDPVDTSGEPLDFQCWPKNDNQWVDESTNPFTAESTAVPSCQGRNNGDGGDLERYIVVTLGRDHDAICDWVAACDGSGTDYGMYCTDPLNKAKYPNNECNVCANCTNPCNTTITWFDTSESNCGAGRKVAATTANKDNEYSAARCKAITTKDGNDQVFIPVGGEATDTKDNTFKICEALKKCDGTATVENCPYTDSNNFFNDGTGNGCIASGVGFETNSSRTGVTPCVEGEFAKAETSCNSSGINRQPRFENGLPTGEVEECAAGEVAFVATTCSKCVAGKFANASSTKYQAGECDDCPTNQYSATGATECSMCPPRHVAVQGDVPCERCNTGEVVKNNVCTQVAIGRYQKPAFDTEFVCEDDSMTTRNIAYFNSGTGSDGCKKCAQYDPDSDGKAYYQAANSSATKCVLIPEGYKRFNSGNNSLVKCTNGTSSAEGIANCQPCSAGTFSDEGAGECQSCAEGFYSGASASVCLEPDAGYFSKDKKNVEYCTDDFYSDKLNRTRCVRRETTLNSKTNGKSLTKIRIKFNLGEEHVEEARTRCDVANELIEGEHFVEGTDLPTLIDDNDGFTGRCRCKRPFGAAANSGPNDHFETDETTGCANDKGQCVGRLSCDGSCNRKDRSDPNNLNCEIVYAKADTPNGPKECVAYHGNIPTKWKETWKPSATEVNCDDAVVSTLSPDLIQ